MRKHILKAISLLLTLSLLLTTAFAAGTAKKVNEVIMEPDENGCYTECKGNCDHAPTIVVPGMGQSATYLRDEAGEIVIDKEGKQITGWPLYVDINYAIKKLIFPLLRMLFLQRDSGLAETAENVVIELFKWNHMDGDGKNVFNIQTDKYYKSVARCTEEEKNYIYANIPLQLYSEAAGEDHLYYFAYNSFGNNFEIVDELHDYIQMVKRETGHDKVNIAFVSLGGTVANGLLDYYPDTYKDINRVIYIIAALDGSRMIGDLFKNDLALDGQNVYEYMMPKLTGDKFTGNLINILLRFVPESALHSVLDAVVRGLMESVLKHCTNMWALVPSGYYEAAADMWLTSPEDAEIRRQTDRYYVAQKNSLRNIQNLLTNGIEVFAITDYSYPLYCFAESFDECNADGLLHVESTGLGTYSVPKGETLPDDYQQKNVNALYLCNCTDPEHHNHISPDRELDASTSLIPDQTFYFYEQDHEATGRNDVIMTLATRLLLDDSIKSVYDDPNFPQFNNARESMGIIRDLLPQAKSVDRSKLTAEQIKKLDTAISDAEEMLAETVVVPGKCEKAEQELKDILVETGYRMPEGKSKTRLFMGEVLEKINNLINKTIGYRAFRK